MVYYKITLKNSIRKISQFYFQTYPNNSFFALPIVSTISFQKYLSDIIKLQINVQYYVKVNFVLFFMFYFFI